MKTVLRSFCTRWVENRIDPLPILTLMERSPAVDMDQGHQSSVRWLGCAVRGFLLGGWVGGFQAASVGDDPSDAQLIDAVSTADRFALMYNLKDRNQRRMFHEVAFRNVRIGSWLALFT